MFLWFITDQLQDNDWLNVENAYNLFNLFYFLQISFPLYIVAYNLNVNCGKPK